VSTEPVPVELDVVDDALREWVDVLRILVIYHLIKQLIIMKIQNRAVNKGL
jgi:hypothetical protein